jgi:hypothetical protein
VHEGATGYDVLEAGGHTFTICSNGVLGNIDGKPRDGCREKNDSVHYWSYWHRAPGKTTWTYSNEGAGTYRPQNRSTEGWRWMKRPPANVPYSQICTSTPSPQPTPHETATHSPTTRVSSAASTTPPTPTATRSKRAHHVRHGPGRGTHAVSAKHALSPTPSAPARVLASDPPTAQSGSNTGRIVAIAAALAVVGGIGIAAWLRGRRGQPS